MTGHEQRMLNSISRRVESFKERNTTTREGLDIINDALQELYKELEERENAKE